MTKRPKPMEQMRVFAMRNLLLEAELSKLESGGVDLGHAETLQKHELVDVELFDRDILDEAARMAGFYVLYYCLENTVRRLIVERLKEKHGAEWWKTAVPNGIRTAVSDKQDREKETVLSIRSEDPLSYTNFGELIAIIEANWDAFSDTIRSKKAMQQTLSQFNQIRNVIAHSCSLSVNDIARLKLLIRDWLNIQT
jgi:HEPN superfamily Swt1-like protein